MPQEARLGSRAERTRAAILEAAEAIFAERGFAATRLEDVAARVGIRRASIVYYFKDKRELYEAVLDSVFGGLLAKLEAVFSRPGPVATRIEDGVSAWVEYAGSRPTIARLILREVADTTPEREPSLLRFAAPFTEVIERQLLESDSAGAQFTSIHPVHLASAIAGATVFFVAAMPTLVPNLGIDPLSSEQLETHREEVLRILRRLLGTQGPRLARR